MRVDIPPLQSYQQEF